MKQTIRKTACIVLVVLFVFFAAAGCGQKSAENVQDTTAPAAAAEEAKQVLTVDVKEINKHGNVILDTTFDEMRSFGMDVGDIITVSAGDAEFDLPVGTAFTDVDNGEMICRFDTEDNEVAAAINMGSFAAETGIGEKQTIEAEPGYKWDVRVPRLRLVLKEKGGYMDAYMTRNLSRTDARTDYPELSDEAFANFRAVSVTGMKKNILYRSSTPIEPAIGRNTYAMAATEKAGIRTVINLDDSVRTMKGYDTFPGSYYSRCRIVNPEMGYDPGTQEFAQAVRESVQFLLENDGPYLIHCKEGKDRTGILCAVLECFAGASEEEIEQDYMTTYENYYGIQPSDTVYGIILNNSFVRTLCGLYQVDDLETGNLRGMAAAYLLSIGLTQAQLSLLAEKLGA